MKHELKTTNLAEILRLCAANGWEPGKVKLSTEVFEDVRYPDVPRVKLFLVHS